MSQNIPLLSICCATYNHERYIRDAIESFLIQETDFPIEIIIHDDASTDDTAIIVRDYADKYPNLIIPIFQKENQYSQGKRIFGSFLYPRVRGKYIAFCEGDDYWISPHKLQRQIDYMESHPECRITFHPVDVIFDGLQLPFPNLVKPPLHHQINLENWLKSRLEGNNYIQPLSVVFRVPPEPLPEWYFRLQFSGDWPLWIWLLRHGGTLVCLEDYGTMGAYRRHNNSVTVVQKNSDKDIKKIIGEANDYHVVSQNTPRNLHKYFRPFQFNIHRRLAEFYLSHDDREQALYHLNRCLANLSLRSPKKLNGLFRFAVRCYFPDFYAKLITIKAQLRKWNKAL
jgi:glycosyltransferase involved in cell wall biosynthesis